MYFFNLIVRFNETYQWNKITMYVYDLTSSQRRIEHCGEINVKCTNGVSCTLKFQKVNKSFEIFIKNLFKVLFIC